MTEEKSRSHVRVLCVALFLVASADSAVAQVWGLDRIDQRDLPLDSDFFVREDGGAGVTVYVMDTGIRHTHTEFDARVARGYDAFLNQGGIRVPDCYSTRDPNTGELKPTGHGTHVAATIGGEDFGVARAVTLVPVRVSQCSEADNEEVRRQHPGQVLSATTIGAIAFERGVNWILANRVPNTPALANVSIEENSPGSIPEAIKRRYDTALRRLQNAGIATIVAAGNFGGDACTAAFARSMDAITVGASTKKDQRQASSNSGGCVDLFAPGDKVMSASRETDQAQVGMSGTSMAAPHVTGVAALYLQQNPRGSIYQVAEAIRRSATTGRLTGASPNRLLYSSLVPDTPGNSRPSASHDDYGDLYAGDNLILRPLLNDWDPNGDSLIIISITQPSSGRLEITSGGTELFLVPNTGLGRKTFTYVISDGKGGIATSGGSYNVVAP